MSRAGLAWAVCLLALLGTPPVAAAPQSPPPDVPQIERETPFDQGRVRIGVSGGTAGSSNNRYFVIGAGVGVFVLDGLEIATDFETWLGGDPSVSKLSPSLRYILHMVPYVHPYVGGLYRHWFIGDDQDDVDTLGGRLGAIFLVQHNAFAGAGVVHEVLLSACDDDCSETYPEIFFSLSF